MVAINRFQMKIVLLFFGNSKVELINTSPVLETTDAAIVGSKSDITLMVIQSEGISVKQVVEAGQRLELAGVNISGCVLNK
ncbi:hypothetical protein [Endozoicomonas sp. Mp262]|uniref:hypothetical protein n=1 Tax=Endozoicomonas sp. Mp262 TaxID=2919499 RepID=UPI0021DB3CE7